jgi:hypothetical protein
LKPKSSKSSKPAKRKATSSRTRESSPM